MMEYSSNYKKHTEYKGIRKILINRFNKNLIKIIKEINPVSILDAGCGEGFIIKLISENIEDELKISGFDLSEQAVGFAGKANKDADIKAASIYNIPFEENSFDLVICSEVLEHLEKPEEALKEINRVAKRNIILTVPQSHFSAWETL
jgi:ubiquinone/menaquinone biosynthesis C-methylase UbiE